MGFNMWWNKEGHWHMVPKGEQDGARLKWVAKKSWDAATKQARFKRFFIVTLLAALVLFEAFQSVAIMENRARLDVLEAPPEIVYPDIAIDTTAPKSPMIYARHKTSLKYKTRWIYAAHNEGVYNDSE